MWEFLLKAALSAGAVWYIAALSAKLAKKSAALERVMQENKERETVDKIMDNVSRLSEHDVRQRLHDIAGKK